MYCDLKACHAGMRVCTMSRVGASVLPNTRKHNERAFYCFRVFGNPGETRSTRSWYRFSNGHDVRWRFKSILRDLDLGKGIIKMGAFINNDVVLCSTNKRNF